MYIFQGEEGIGIQGVQGPSGEPGEKVHTYSMTFKGKNQ